ncbi:type II toxin-antitoxin system RelE/ParE family toxin [archaeon]|nr:type II toxin-antitoxin system RelE/ParE family toxin [archaeon]
MFDVKLDKQPEKFLKNCEKLLFDRIVSKLKELKENPVPHDAKRIAGYELPTFRIRIGKYRSLYRINYQTNTIIVVKIDHRENVYK